MGEQTTELSGPDLGAGVALTVLAEKRAVARPCARRACRAGAARRGAVRGRRWRRRVWTEQYDFGLTYVGHAERYDRVQIDGDLAARDCTITYRRGQEASGRGRAPRS